MRLTGNKQKSGIHNSGSVQHCSHKNVVTGAINEAYMTIKLEATGAWWSITRKTIILSRSSRSEANGSRAFRVIALIDFRIGVALFEIKTWIDSPRIFYSCINLPSLIVMFLSSSFLKRTVCTLEMALTTVDFPCATCPIVPILMVAWRDITSGDWGVNFVTS